MKFHLVRYFSAASILAIILVSITLLYLQREAQTRAMIEQEEHNNINISQIISNSISDKFEFFISDADDIPPEELRHHHEVKELKNFLTSYFNGLEIVEISFMNKDGAMVFSTNLDKIGENHKNRPSFLSALNHKPASDLRLGGGESDGHGGHGDGNDSGDQSGHDDGGEKNSDDHIVITENNKFEKDTNGIDIVSTHIPLYKQGTREIGGVLQINSEITHFLEDIHAAQIMVVVGVVGVLGLLFIVLLIIVIRASKIIQSQADENEKSMILLAQSEKMASLGNMVASVAHELNTPLAFTSSNIDLVSDALQNLKLPVKCGNGLIEKFQASGDKKVNIRISDEKLKAEVINYSRDFEVEDLGEMLAETKTGLDQMSGLVKHLRNFTRIDRSAVAKYDLNEGLKTVLYISKVVIPVGVTVVKDFGELPLIECMPSKLHQVFMNLITNAAQAVDKKSGIVTVKSSSLGDKVRVEVSDNGKGIAPKDLENIFDGHFTTKNVEGGMGLGLSIVKKIIEQHGGTIDVKSEVGVGTTFTVDLLRKGVAEETASS